MNKRKLHAEKLKQNLGEVWKRNCIEPIARGVLAGMGNIVQVWTTLGSFVTSEGSAPLPLQLFRGREN